MSTLEGYISQADVLRQDLGRIALQIDEAARAVDDARRLPQDLAARIRETDEHIKQIELEIRSEVSTETIELSSKLAFPNEDSRKAEIGKRVRRHPEMAEYAETKRQLDNDKLSADLRLAGASDLLKAYTIVAQLRSQEVELLASVINAVARTGETVDALEKFLSVRIAESFRTGKLGRLLDDKVKAVIDGRPA
jgi:hypothetical protein